jgi:hypothetical protein
VQATLGAGDILASDCSCPVGGRCKHVAALHSVEVPRSVPAGNPLPAAGSAIGSGCG